MPDLIDQLFTQAGFTTTAPTPKPSQAAPAQTTPAPAAAATPAPAPGTPAPAPTPAPAVEPAAATPAATPEPAPKPAEPAPAAAPTFDYLKGLAGGKYTTPEALSEYISDLESKAATEPFANEYIKGLNEAVKQGVDAEVYHKFATIDPKKISDREAMILELQWDKKLSVEDATTYVDHKYRLGEDEDVNDQSVKMARIEAKVDAAKAKEFIASHRAEALTPPIEKIMERQKAAWAPEIPKVVEQFKTISIKGAAGEFNLPVAPEVLAKAEKTLSEILSREEFRAMPDKQGRQFAEQIVRNAVIVESLGQIWDAAVDETEKKHALGNHNPKGVGSTPPPVAPVKSEDQAKGEFVLNSLGIK